MQISLIRHGKSEHIDKQLITANEFRMWVEHYDSSRVIEELKYPAETLEKLDTAKIIFVSDLARSVDSARLLQPSVSVQADKLFRECELPIPLLPLVKLNPGTWAVLLRFLWLCGYSKGCESYRDARKRAEAAAQCLIEYAREYGSVALVGHGFFNLLIAKQLRGKRWTGPKKAGTKHWSCTTYDGESGVFPKRG